ncbi:MAG TPA: hypothetical protein VGO96_18440 [Pyrinomonadaceae bacterium]|jgi:hypothetical protein|nr:hypothetical protein [Pyrinomonadaceae bacterium]
MPRLTLQEKAELRTLRNTERLELIKSSIRGRWGLNDWEVRYPWWRDPAQVRILMYADGQVSFVDGTFGGLTYVKTLLESRAYFYVDFEITTAHRERNNTGATLPGPRLLTDPELDILNKFDQIWFFGHNSDPDLSKDELELLDAFMKPPKCGGVLVTGDHENLGRGIAGQIRRAGKMRLYPAPKRDGAEHNTTLEEGPDENATFDENDQSDDLPQTIIYKRFPVWSQPGFKRLYRPHPVLCGPDGPIDVLPDHQHEGEAIAPTDEQLDADWPTRVDGHQERPVVIAHGKTKEPGAGNREFGVVSAYDGHNVNVGRIVADSTWHHWFDFNLLGIDLPPHYLGFEATPRGRAALKKIDAYFLNCGVWLAPPERHAEMRKAAWWSIVWTGQIVELSPNEPIFNLGAEAISVLKLRASSCAVTDWVLGSTAFNNEIPKLELQETLKQLTNLSLEQYVAGGILQQLILKVGLSNPERLFPSEPPSDEILQSAIDAGVDEGLSALKAQFESETSLVAKLVADNFRLA